MTDSFEHIAETRALQESLPARQHNHDSMVRWGAYSLVKVTPQGAPHMTVMGFVTNLPAISGKTPRQMETMLGLRLGQLANGADIYRLLDIPDKDGFLPRGYSTLVDGLVLKSGLTQDAHGYRPGQGAWQITLIKPVPVVKIASLAYDKAFEPGIHPN